MRRFYGWGSRATTLAQRLKFSWLKCHAKLGKQRTVSMSKDFPKLGRAKSPLSGFSPTVAVCQRPTLGTAPIRKTKRSRTLNHPGWSSGRAERLWTVSWCFSGCRHCDSFSFRYAHASQVSGCVGKAVKFDFSGRRGATCMPAGVIVQPCKVNLRYREAKQYTTAMGP